MGRRYKIMNPDRMRSDYGKLMYLLMDASDPAIQARSQRCGWAAQDPACPGGAVPGRCCRAPLFAAAASGAAMTACHTKHSFSCISSLSLFVCCPSTDRTCRTCQPLRPQAGHSPAQELLDFNCVRPLRTVHALLEDKGGLALLHDPALPVATAGRPSHSRCKGSGLCCCCCCCLPASTATGPDQSDSGTRGSQAWHWCITPSCLPVASTGPP